MFIAAFADERLRCNVRYWHKADIQEMQAMSAFGGKADLTCYFFLLISMVSAA